jgi:hypothetical protein
VSMEMSFYGWKGFSDAANRVFCNGGRIKAIRFGCLSNNISLIQQQHRNATAGTRTISGNLTQFSNEIHWIITFLFNQHCFFVWAIQYAIFQRCG